MELIALLYRVFSIIALYFAFVCIQTVSVQAEEVCKTTMQRKYVPKTIRIDSPRSYELTTDFGSAAYRTFPVKNGNYVRNKGYSWSQKIDGEVVRYVFRQYGSHFELQVTVPVSANNKEFYDGFTWTGSCTKVIKPGNFKLSRGNYSTSIVRNVLNI